MEISIIVDIKQMKLLVRRVKTDKTFSCHLEKITYSKTNFKDLLDKIYARRVLHKLQQTKITLRLTSVVVANLQATRLKHLNA